MSKATFAMRIGLHGFNNRNAVIALLFTLLLIPTVTAAGVRDDIENGLRAAIDGDAERAIEHLTQAIESPRITIPLLTIALTARCQMYGQREETYALAVEDCTQAISLNSRLVQAYRARGDAYALGRKWNETIEDYSKVIALGKGDPETFVARGRAYQELDKLEDAIDDYNRAIEMRPGYAEAYAERGRALYEIDEAEAAFSDLDKAVALEPTSAIVRVQRAHILLYAGHHDRAIEDFTFVVQEHPDAALAYTLRGFAYYVAGQLNAAFADFEVATRTDPDSPSAYLFRGLAAFDNGDYTEAIRDFEMSLNLAPETVAHVMPVAPVFLYLSRSRAGQSGELELSRYVDMMREPEWFSHVPSFLMGEMTKEEFLDAIQKSHELEEDDLDCEVQYLIAQNYLLRKDKQAALSAFDAVSSKSDSDCLYKQSAIAEIRRMNASN